MSTIIFICLSVISSLSLPIVSSRFLWRPNATFAISRHYRRFDVFVEAEANKAAGKYENASIDRQVRFYQYHDGLTRYSRAKLPITSGRNNFDIFTCLHVQNESVICRDMCLCLRIILHHKSLKYCFTADFLQMFLKVVLSLENTFQLQICLPACGSMKLIALLPGIS